MKSHKLPMLGQGAASKPIPIETESILEKRLVRFK